MKQPKKQQKKRLSLKFRENKLKEMHGKKGQLLTMRYEIHLKWDQHKR